MTSRATRRRGLVLAAATALVSGVAVFLNGYGVRAWADPTAYTAVKNLAAAALIGVAAVPVIRSRGVPPRATWGRLVAIGVIGGGVPFALFFRGLAVTDPTRAALIHKSLLIWVAVMAVPALAERLDRWHVVAIGLLVSGQVLLGPISVGWGAGETMILAATLLWAVEVVVVKRLVPEVDPIVAAAVRLGFGAVVLFAWTAATGGLAAIATADTAAWAWVVVTSATLALFVAGWYTALSLAPAIDVTAVLAPGALITMALSNGVRGTAAPGLAAVVALALGVAAVLVAGRRAAPA